MDVVIADSKNLSSNTLKIGFVLLSVQDLAPNIIFELQKRYSRVKFQLYTGLSNEILQKVIDFEYHVGIIVRVKYPENLIYRELQKQKLYFITTDNLKDQVHLRELANCPIILPTEGAAFREIIVNEFKDRGVPLSIRMESVDPSALKSMVERGMGGAFLPMDSIEQDVKEGKFRAIEILERIYFYFDVIYLRERRRSKSVRSIISAIDDIKFNECESHSHKTHSNQTR
jgi:DNA-binding transcriptional LysR family regulator